MHLLPDLLAAGDEAPRGIAGAATLSHAPSLPGQPAPDKANAAQFAALYNASASARALQPMPDAAPPPASPEAALTAPRTSPSQAQIPQSGITDAGRAEKTLDDMALAYPPLENTGPALKHGKGQGTVLIAVAGQANTSMPGPQGAASKGALPDGAAPQAASSFSALAGEAADETALPGRTRSDRVSATTPMPEIAIRHGNPAPAQAGSTVPMAAPVQNNGRQGAQNSINAGTPTVTALAHADPVVTLPRQSTTGQGNSLMPSGDASGADLTANGTAAKAQPVPPGDRPMADVPRIQIASLPSGTLTASTGNTAQTDTPSPQVQAATARTEATAPAPALASPPLPMSATLHIRPDSHTSSSASPVTPQAGRTPLQGLPTATTPDTMTATPETPPAADAQHADRAKLAGDMPLPSQGDLRSGPAAAPMPAVQPGAQGAEITPLPGSAATPMSAPAGAPATAAASAPVQALTPAVQQQALQQVTAGIEMAHHGARGMELRLDPPELGRVLIDFRFEGDARVTAVLQADQPETAALIRRSLDVLMRDLAAAGFSDINLSMDNGSGQGRSGNAAGFGADAGQNTAQRQGDGSAKHQQGAQADNQSGDLSRTTPPVMTHGLTWDTEAIDIRL